MAYSKGKQIKGKGKNSRFTRNGFKKDEPDSAVAKEKFNDASWYVSREQIAKDVASLSFNNALGAPSDIDFVRDEYTTNSSYTLNVPGIYTILTVPTMGYSTDGSSPINIAAKNIYSWVRHQNSGHSNYDSPDLMMYLGAMDSVYAAIAYLMRIYGVARVFSQTNRYIGDALLDSMGVNPNEVRANLADFRSYINMVITKASAFCTPNMMTLYRRHFWMYSGVYKDEDITKSQLYMYRPAALWQYEETDGAGRLQTIPFISSLSEGGDIFAASVSLATLRTTIDGMLSKLTASEDINIMSGDILKAYGREGLWVLGLINEDYVTLPVYSAEVLEQIHNTTLVGRRPTRDATSSSTTWAYTWDAFNVYQNPNVGDGALLCNPQIVGSKHLGYAKLLDMMMEDPSPEDVLVATRNTVMGTPMLCGTTGSYQVVTSLNTFASDIALYAVISTLNNGNYQKVAITGGDTNYGADLINTISRFKQAPLLYSMSGASSANYMTDIVGELNNYTVIDWNDLNKMHESAILAMLGVPFYGVAK